MDCIVGFFLDYNGDYFMDQFFVIEPFNLVYFVFIGVVFVAAAVFFRAVKKKPKEERWKIMVMFTSCVAALLLFYKFSFRLDAEFIEDYPKYWGEYTILNELPINPCNLVILLMPLALYKKNDWLLSYCVFMGLISTSVAILAPQQGYAGYSILKWHTFGFFLLHSLGIAIPAGVVYLGLYKPKYKDIPKAVTVLAVTTLFAYLISLFLRKTGLCSVANYSFTMDPEGNPVLEFFYRLLPVQGLYVVGLLLMFIPGTIIIVTIYRMLQRKRMAPVGKKEETT
ncbi:MAG: YwaF family protein [Prevotellaceae bacterium]|nr:YwaF family protein [Candidatus Colivivens equi]